MLRRTLLIGAVAGAAAATPCVDPTWTPEQVEVQSDIVFGSSVNNGTGERGDLLLDAYFPPSTDNRTARPAAVLVHGGAFKFGTKNMKDMKDMAQNLVIRGFVAVSINYRLMGFHYGVDNDKAPLDATEDARAAIRFVRSKAAEWRVDPSRVLVAGDSAGAVTSLYLGYVKKAQYEGPSGNPGFGSAVKLAVAVSGELKTEAFCRSVDPNPPYAPKGCITEGGPEYDYTDDVDGQSKQVDGSPQPAMLLVHGTADKTVPYVDGKAAYDRAQASGIKSGMITIPGAGHVPFKELFTEGTYLEDFATFIAGAMELGAAQCPR